MNKRLVIGAALVAVVGGFLVSRCGTRDQAAPPATTSAPGTSPGSTAPSARPSLSANPALPSGGSAIPSEPTAAPSLPPEVPTYAVGDVIVRDHRGSNATPMDVQPVLRPPTSAPIAPTVTRAIGEAVRTRAMTCFADLTAAERGPHPKLDAFLSIAIKDGAATVITARPVLRDILGPRVAALTTCATDQMLGSTSAASGEADREKYDITTSYIIH